MKRFYPLIFLVFLIPSFSLAQSNYKPGYMVKLNGDTVKGYIDYKEWEKNPDAVLFKRNVIDTVIDKVTPDSLNAFAVTGFEYFRSFIVHISHAQVSMENIKQGADTSYFTRKVFLLLLTKGDNIALYSYTDDIKTRYYIVDNESIQPIELIYRQYYKPDDAAFVVTDNAFRLQLQRIAERYNMTNNKLKIDIQTSKYGDDLIEIAQKINGTTNHEFTPGSLAGFRWYIGAGLIDNVLTFKDGPVPFPSESKSILPAINGGIDLIPNKNTQQLFLRLELSLNLAQHSYFKTLDNSGNPLSTANLTQYNLAFSPQFGYSFYNTNKLQVFIDLGFTLTLTDYSNYNLSNSQILNNYPSFSNFWFSFPLKIGVILNRNTQLYLGVSPAANLNSHSDGYIAEETQYTAGINYLFGVK